MAPFPIDYSAFCTYDTATLTVPSGTRTAYRNTEGWYNFVKINDNQVNVVISSVEHSNEIANKIIKKVQEQFKENVYVTIKFSLK